MAYISKNSYSRLRLQRLLPIAALIGFVLIVSVADAAKDAGSRLERVSVNPRAAYTRVSFFLSRSPDYTLSLLPSGKISLTIRKTGGPLFKRLRTYSDRFIEGIRIVPRGEDLRVTITAKGQPGVRQFWLPEGSILAVDVGPQFSEQTTNRTNRERDPIRTGAGRLVKEFDPPFKPIFPFLPTDRRELLKVVSEQDAKLFMAGEAALYNGKAAQAIELFTVFSQRESPVRSLATYRLGESLYILQKYDAALKAFQDAQKLWPEYMSINPAVAFYYADSIARNGDFAGGRKSLARLIAGLSDRKYAPLLLVRLADTLARQQHEMEAQAIYRTVAANFPRDKAGGYAALKLADRRIFTVTDDNYVKLLQEYQNLVEKGTDPSLREEALFKCALLESLYGPAPAALQLVIQYERKYPRGLFIAIARGMREELLPIICRDLYAVKDFAALAAVVQDNQNYLARCFADGGFVNRVDEAFTSLGLLKKEIALFRSLLDREWAASSVPFMLMRMIDQSIALADFAEAEATALGFIQKFPRHQGVNAVREKLGKIKFHKGDMPAVAVELGWLLAGSNSPESPESWYYLGKALASQQNHKNADKALFRHISLVKDLEVKPPLLADAYYACASERAAGGDRAGGLSLYRTGLEIAGSDMRDQFLYKIGELYLQEGKNDEAKHHWERIVKEGTDPVWQKMAAQALADLAWREQYKDVSK